MARALWRQLLDGRLTEVFVFGSKDGSVLGAHLPQTLGLEPIVCNAYKYTATGELRGGTGSRRRTHQASGSMDELEPEA